MPLGMHVLTPWNLVRGGIGMGDSQSGQEPPGANKELGERARQDP